ncbi:MAG: TonB-dependent receptor [Verrucomicrobia bacterium]|nr:TonB-dependent receptor [Verrucomicrobiota bacterium]
MLGRTLIVVLMFVASAVAAVAQTNLPARLPEVVVTATRSESMAFDLPHSTLSLSRDVIQDEHLSRTVPEALREVPGVMIQKTAHGQGSPYIRGFTGFRTLMLIDGIRLNNSTFRDGPNQYWNTVDPFSVERLELVKGPSSVLYGSDAIGGTVNALTLAPPDHLSGRAYYRFASAEDSHTGRAEGGGKAGPFSLLAGVSVKSYGDLNDQPKTGYDEWDTDLKAEYRISDSHKLVAAWQHVVQDDAWRTHRTIYAVPFHGTAIGAEREVIYDQKRDLAYLQYHADDIGGVVDSFKLSGSYQFQGEDMNRLRSNYRRELSVVDVHTMGLSAQLVSPSPVGTWTYGVEFYRDWVNSGQTTYNSNGTLRAVSYQGPVADDATYDLFGLYVQNELDITARWKLIVGGRYTFAGVDAGKVSNTVTQTRMSISDEWHSGVGSGRVIYQLDEKNHWHIFAGVSQGFRAPNLSDLTRFDVARGGTEGEVPSPGLRPEQFITGEIGLKTRYDKFEAELSYYYSAIEDMIVRAPTGNMIDPTTYEVIKRNADSGYLHGIELSARYRFLPQWSVFGWVSWMEGKVDGYPTSSATAQTEYLSRVMPLSGEIGVRWETENRRFWAEAVTLMADTADKLASGDLTDNRIPPGGTPGYAVFTVRGGWRINQYANLTVALENIADKDYRVHGSGVNEPGRNFIVAADVRF